MNMLVQTLEEIFSQISPTDEETLISLPYRVGLYVSYSDISGGWDAQEKELQALTGILRAYSEDFCKSEFSQKVLMDSLCARDRWPAWSQNIENVPQESARIVKLLTPIFNDSELNEFKEVLVEIALAVAMAFRETGPEMQPMPDQLGFTDLLRRIIGAHPTEDPLSHVNISATEKSALLGLCASLSYTGFERA